MWFPDQETSHPEATWPQRRRLLLLESGSSHPELLSDTSIWKRWKKYSTQDWAVTKIGESQSVASAAGGVKIRSVRASLALRLSRDPPLWFLPMARVALLRTLAAAIAKLHHCDALQGQAQSLISSSSKVWALHKIQLFSNVGTREGSKISMGQEEGCKNQAGWKPSA